MQYCDSHMQEGRYYKLLTNKTNTYKTKLQQTHSYTFWQIQTISSLLDDCKKQVWDLDDGNSSLLAASSKAKAAAGGGSGHKAGCLTAPAARVTHFLARIGRHKTRGMSNRPNTKLFVKTPLPFNPSSEVAFLKNNDHYRTSLSCPFNMQLNSTSWAQGSCMIQGKPNSILKGTRKWKETHTHTSALQSPTISEYFKTGNSSLLDIQNTLSLLVSDSSRDFETKCVSTYRRCRPLLLILELLVFQVSSFALPVLLAQQISDSKQIMAAFQSGAAANNICYGAESRRYLGTATFMLTEKAHLEMLQKTN